MAQTIGFGDLLDPSQQNQQQGQGQQQGQQQSSAPSQNPGAGQQGSVAQAGATQSGGTGGGGSTGAQAGSQYKPQAYSQQTQGTGFVNLQQYLNANNPAQLQGAVASNLNQQNQNTMGTLQGSQQQFQQGLQANQANSMANQGLVQNVLANPTGYSAATGANPQAGTPAGNAPAGGAGNSAPNLAQGSQFSQLIGGQYGGPTALTGADQLAAQGVTAGQNAQNLQSAAGRTSILQGLMANPNYTQGQASLDTALLGQGNQAGINQAANQGRQLQQVINQANAGATAQGQEAASNAQQFGQQVQGQLTNQVQGQLAGLQNQAAQTQQQRTTQYNQMLSDLQSGNVTQDEANMLGLTQGENVYNVLQNAGNYVSANPTQATAQNVASAQDYAKMQALQQLAGSNAGSAATGVFQQFANPSQAGTIANTPVAQANQSAFQNALQSTANQYQSTLAPVQQQEQAAQNIVNFQQGNYGAQDVTNAINAANSSGQTNLAKEIQMAANQGGSGVGQLLIDALYSGAATGGITRADWAASNLQTAQQQMAATQANLNAAYGTPETINITPQQSSIGPQLSNMLQPGQVTANV